MGTADMLFLTTCRLNAKVHVFGKQKRSLIKKRKIKGKKEGKKKRERNFTSKNTNSKEEDIVTIKRRNSQKKESYYCQIPGL